MIVNLGAWFNKEQFLSPEFWNCHSDLEKFDQQHINTLICLSRTSWLLLAHTLSHSVKQLKRLSRLYIKNQRQTWKLLY